MTNRRGLETAGTHSAYRPIKEYRRCLSKIHKFFRPRNPREIVNTNAYKPIYSGLQTLQVLRRRFHREPHRSKPMDCEARHPEAPCENSLILIKPFDCKDPEAIRSLQKLCIFCEKLTIYPLCFAKSYRFNRPQGLWGS